MFAFLIYVVQTVLSTAVGVCPPAAKLEPCKCNAFDRGDKDEGFLWFNCDELYLGDEKMSQVLDAFISTSGVSPLRELHLFRNNLTRIPDQIRHFTELNRVILNSNEIQSIKNGSFHFTPTLDIFTLRSNKITTIEPGAFDGIISFLKMFYCFYLAMMVTYCLPIIKQTSTDINFGTGSFLNFEDNNLTRFDKDVFLLILEEMVSNSNKNSNLKTQVDINNSYNLQFSFNS